MEKLRLSYIAYRNIRNFGKQVGHSSEVKQSHPHWLSSTQDNIGRNMALLILSIWQVKCVFQNWGSYVSSRDGNQLKKKGKLSFSGPERHQKPRFHFISGRNNTKTPRLLNSFPFLGLSSHWLPLPSYNNKRFSWPTGGFRETEIQQRGATHLAGLLS